MIFCIENEKLRCGVEDIRVHHEELLKKCFTWKSLAVGLKEKLFNYRMYSFPNFAAVLFLLYSSSVSHRQENALETLMAYNLAKIFILTSRIG